MTVNGGFADHLRFGRALSTALAGGDGVAIGQSMVTRCSCGKGVVATTMHQLVERRRLGYDTLVADYWDLPRYALRKTIEYLWFNIEDFKQRARSGRAGCLP